MELLERRAVSGACGDVRGRDRVDLRLKRRPVDGASLNLVGDREGEGLTRLTLGSGARLCGDRHLLDRRTLIRAERDLRERVGEDFVTPGHDGVDRRDGGCRVGGGGGLTDTLRSAACGERNGGSSEDEREC